MKNEFAMKQESQEAGIFLNTYGENVDKVTINISLQSGDNVTLSLMQLEVLGKMLLDLLYAIKERQENESR